MVKKKFIDKKNARHFHLVHRSQRDPLIVDAEASDRVFKEITKGKTTEDKQLRQLDNDDEREQQVGQAALYGVYLDDSEYDYTQHLRPMGNQGAVFIEAPSRERKEKKTSVQIKDDTSLNRLPQVELPADVLPSNYEMSIGLMNQPAMLEGLQPDMDPELREALEALELSGNESAELEDGFDDDLIAQLNTEISVPKDALEFNVVEESEEEEEEEEEEGEGWEKRFMRFKQARAAAACDEQSDHYDNNSVGTGFSMSSSAMFRNEKLTMLDEQFERIQEEYERESDDDEDEPNIDPRTGKPALVAIKQREDFEAILDDFLEKYEVVGKKMLPVLHGSSSDKLGAYRQALLVDDDADASTIKEAASQLNKQVRQSSTVDTIEMLYPQEKERDAWDCESILSTYSNLENHPALIQEPNRRIRISRKSGMPIVEEISDEIESTKVEHEKKAGVNLGAARPKNETQEERKLRKGTAKEARRDRRVAKKNNRLAYKLHEIQRQQVDANRQKMLSQTHFD